MKKSSSSPNKEPKALTKTIALTPELHGWLKSLSKEYELRSMAATVATLLTGWRSLDERQRRKAAGIVEEAPTAKEIDGVVMGRWLQENL